MAACAYGSGGRPGRTTVMALDPADRRTVEFPVQYAPERFQEAALPRLPARRRCLARRPPGQCSVCADKNRPGLRPRDLSRFGWVHELKIEKVAGDNQWAAPNTAVAVAPTVKVTSAYPDGAGSPVEGVKITFKASGSSTVPGDGIVSTDANGLASTSWTVGSLSGQSYTLQVAKRTIPNWVPEHAPSVRSTRAWFAVGAVRRHRRGRNAVEGAPQPMLRSRRTSRRTRSSG
jgi:hypothetical protein